MCLNVEVKEVTGTPFYREERGELQQLVRLRLHCSRPIEGLSVETRSQYGAVCTKGLRCSEGEGVYEIYASKRDSACVVEIVLSEDSTNEQARSEVRLPESKLWEVQLVHYAHHDIGYTDLPHSVLGNYENFYESLLGYCSDTDGYPDEAKFTYTIEQSCTLENYFARCKDSSRREFIKRIHEGRIEVTALFGNMVTELCGHEELVRLIYPAMRLKRDHGIPVRTAMHNDIPGVSWALSSILADAGIDILFMGIPRWYFHADQVNSKCAEPAPQPHPIWDESRVITFDHPGGFRWKAPNENELLFWYDLHGTGELYLWDVEQAQSDLEEQLGVLEQGSYSLDFVRYTIRGGNYDNAPPMPEICDTVMAWNQKWAYPRLSLSTNTEFLERIKPFRDDFNAHGGELPNTDYTIGALSGARETAINRVTHDRLTAAEKFASIVDGMDQVPYPRERIEEAYTNAMYYDMHCFGMQMPFGPAHEGAWAEKGTFSYRASALTHDLLVKSANRLTDQIKLDSDRDHVVVLNSLSFERNDIVDLPFVGAVPCGTNTVLTQSISGALTRRSATGIHGRREHRLSPDLLQNEYSLVDMDTGKNVAYQIVKLDDPNAPVECASDRYALGMRDERHLYSLLFPATDVPSLGYKTYQLVPGGTSDEGEKVVVGRNSLENRFYRIEVDENTGAVVSIWDSILKRELVDSAAPHGFFSLFGRSATDGTEFRNTNVEVRAGNSGCVQGSLRISGAVKGCPTVEAEIVLYRDIRKIDFRVRVLRDCTPYLEEYVGFPFAVPSPKFTYESNSGAVRPVEDQLPGSNTDYYAVQHWANVAGEGWGIRLSSIDAPVMEFGGLNPGYVSGAHHGITPPGYGHPFRISADYENGHIYSYLMNNNSRTNFRNVQVGDSLFRFSLSTYEGDWKSSGEYRNGWESANPPLPVVRKRNADGVLPYTCSFCTVDSSNVMVLNMKRSDNGNDLIVRLIELEGNKTDTTLHLPRFAISSAYRAGPDEESESELSVEPHGVKVSVRPFSIETIRIITERSGG